MIFSKDDKNGIDESYHCNKSEIHKAQSYLKSCQEMREGSWRRHFAHQDLDLLVKTFDCRYTKELQIF